MPRVLFDFRGLDATPVRADLADPVHILTARAVDEVVPALRAVQEGIASGLSAAGYVAYEAAPAFEPRMHVRSGGRMPLVWFGLFEEQHPRHIRAAKPPGAAETPTPEAPLPWNVSMDRATHAAAVATIRDRIAHGVTYQVNLTARLHTPFDGDPLALWERMRRAQGPGYHAWLDIGRFVIASVSPELFFRRRGPHITTRPMKGTRPRGRWQEEDDALRDTLAGSAKDRAENLMIVDLLRNDLGRIARTGSVAVPRLLDVERYRTVWQMTSTITATLRDGVGLVEILEALFPCGSVTGAPKISTMEIIAGIEDAPREVYCGAIGLVRPNGDATFSVPIRTAWIDRETGEAEYGAGGGVVWDSSTSAEYDELLAKAVVVRAPWPEFRLLETIRLQDGRFLRLDRHLSRLRRAAERFDFPLADDAVCAALDTLRTATPQGVHRVRLLVDEAGRIEVSAEPLQPPWHDGVPADDVRPQPIALARTPVYSADPFLFHKTTRRDAYELARAEAAEGAWDVVMVNEEGHATELTRGNLVLELEGRWLTPPVTSGLLPGCLRAELLEAGTIDEAVLRPADLRRPSRAWLINSLRGWVPIRLMP